MSTTPTTLFTEGKEYIPKPLLRKQSRPSTYSLQMNPWHNLQLALKVPNPIKAKYKFISN